MTLRRRGWLCGLVLVAPAGVSCKSSGSADAAAVLEGDATSVTADTSAAADRRVTMPKDSAPYTPGETVAIAAAGDISGGHQGETAALLRQLIKDKSLRAVLPLGDLAYNSGTMAEFQNGYHPYWGNSAIRKITYPALGNHEYWGDRQGASGFFDYFSGTDVPAGVPGERGEGYYSYDLGAWHLIALNSSDNCNPVPCKEGSAQHLWLKDDLANSSRRCTLAYWHHPRFNLGAMYGDHPNLTALWNLLYDAGAEVVLNGHEHNYQQIGPMNKRGELDRAAGVREFIVGTGGASNFYGSFTNAHADAAELKLTDTYGVLELTLKDGDYDWRFVSVDNTEVVKGHDVCH